MNGKLSTGLVPPTGTWYGTREAATYFHRDPETIRKWCRDGTFLEFGYDVYIRGPKDSKGGRGEKYYICIPGLATACTSDW